MATQNWIIIPPWPLVSLFLCFGINLNFALFQSRFPLIFAWKWLFCLIFMTLWKPISYLFHFLWYGGHLQEIYKSRHVGRRFFTHHIKHFFKYKITTLYKLHVCLVSWPLIFSFRQCFTILRRQSLLTCCKIISSLYRIWFIIRRRCYSVANVMS